MVYEAVEINAKNKYRAEKLDPFFMLDELEQKGHFALAALCVSHLSASGSQADAHRSVSDEEFKGLITGTYHGGELRIEWLYVRPVYRERGIGEFLLNTVSKIAVSMGHTHLQAGFPDADIDDEYYDWAEDFLESHGFYPMDSLEDLWELKLPAADAEAVREEITDTETAGVEALDTGTADATNDAYGIREISADLIYSYEDIIGSPLYKELQVFKPLERHIVSGADLGLEHKLDFADRMFDMGRELRPVALESRDSLFYMEGERVLCYIGLIRDDDGSVLVLDYGFMDTHADSVDIRIVLIANLIGTLAEDHRSTPESLRLCFRMQEKRFLEGIVRLLGQPKTQIE